MCFYYIWQYMYCLCIMGPRRNVGIIPWFACRSNKPLHPHVFVNMGGFVLFFALTLRGSILTLQGKDILNLTYLNILLTLLDKSNLTWDKHQEQDKKTPPLIIFKKKSEIRWWGWLLNKQNTGLHQIWPIEFRLSYNVINNYDKMEMCKI